jgi:hypothetical protein
MTYTSRKHYSQAFPKTTAQRDGMTLRDYFAAKAMQSLILDSFYQSEGASKGWTEIGPEVAEDAYIMADLMLKARDGHQG